MWAIVLYHNPAFIGFHFAQRPSQRLNDIQMDSSCSLVQMY